MKKNCNRCGRPIEFIRGEGGRAMAVDPGPIYVLPREGTQVVVTVGGKIRRGKRAYTGEPGAILAYVPHFATCPCKPEFSQYEYRNRKPMPKPPPQRKKPEPPPPPPTPPLPRAEQLSLIG